MTRATIAQLILMFGPQAIELIAKLRALWTKTLTDEEVMDILKLANKSYDDYINQQAALAAK